MRIAVSSRSASVTRALEALIEHGGHTCCRPADAELLIVDKLHPAALPEPLSLPVITLGGAGAEAIHSPARVSTVLQAITRAASPALPLGGGWSLDPTARMLLHAEQPGQSLTEKECLLLATLAAAAGPMAREQLLSQVWGMAAQAETHTLETHVYRLRTKLSGLKPPACDVMTEGGSYRLALA